jgi:hypothetical protein
VTPGSPPGGWCGAPSLDVDPAIRACHVQFGLGIRGVGDAKGIFVSTQEFGTEISRAIDLAERSQPIWFRLAALITSLLPSVSLTRKLSRFPGVPITTLYSEHVLIHPRLASSNLGTTDIAAWQKAVFASRESNRL